MEEELQNQFKLDPVEPFELAFHNLQVVATIEEKVDVGAGKMIKQPAEKVILNKCSGIFEPMTFNAIVGPSGCGKTTMLNLLSGRLLSTNLSLSGELLVNAERVYDINKFGQCIGYVMQEDLLLPTFSPRESFKFIADLRLPEVSSEDKYQRVQDLIKALGLSKCADTYIGNAMIRGVSGGEKKRTSIGIQLLINPSIIFLDEPTTGLDSTTALHVMKFLNKIAKAGRTVISTIHQPSSEIFAEFDRLMILVQGNIVYQGDSQSSMRYFSSIGFPVKKHSNPPDYYMKIMNKEGLSLEFLERGEDINDEEVLRLFEERVSHFKECYNREPRDFQPKVTSVLSPSGSEGTQPFVLQCYYIFQRAVRKQFRNPLDLKMKLLQMIVQGVVSIILFYKKADTAFSSIQNTTGCLFFMLMTNAFGGIIANIATFSSERSIFIRERMSNSYSTLAYYTGRSMSCIPIEIFLPLLFMVIAYFPSNLDNSTGVFFMSVLAIELCYFMAASYGLMISTIIKDFNVAIALVPVLIIPQMLVAGYFVTLNQVPHFFYWLEYISAFKYGFASLMYNQYRHPVDCGDGQYCDLVATRFKFPDTFIVSMFLMLTVGLIFRIIAFFGMVIISSPKRVKLPAEGEQKELSFGDKIKACCGLLKPPSRPPATQPRPVIIEAAPVTSYALQPPLQINDQILESRIPIRLQQSPIELQGSPKEMEAQNEKVQEWPKPRGQSKLVHGESIERLNIDL